MVTSLSQGRRHGWDSLYIITLLVVAAIAGLIFVCTGLYRNAPFVSFQLYRNRAFALPATIMLIEETCFVSIISTTIFFLQQQLHYTPLQAAQLMIPAAIVSSALRVWSGRLSNRMPAQILIALGLALETWCLFQFATITPWTSAWVLTFWLAFRQVARSFRAAPLLAISIRSLMASELRMGSGLLSLNRGIAGACGVAISAAILQHRTAGYTSHLGQTLAISSYGQDQLVQRLTTMFENTGDFHTLAAAKSHATLHHLLHLEASLHSYHDMFLLVGWISALCIVPTLWMRGGNLKNRRDSKSDGH